MINEAWQKAVEKGDLDRLKALKKMGVDINQSIPALSSSALVYAASRCGIDVIEWLFEENADPKSVNSVGMNALHVAASSDHLHLIQLLVTYGVPINEKDISGQTPLFGVRNPDVLKYLFENGADLTLTDSIRLTAYDHAFSLQRGNDPLIEMYKSLFALQDKRELDQNTFNHSSIFKHRTRL